MKIGQFVRYFGSDTEMHGVFTIAFVPRDKKGRGYVLKDEYGPVMENVHFSSIVPTDEFVGAFSY